MRHWRGKPFILDEGGFFSCCLLTTQGKPANPNCRFSPNPRTPVSKHLQRLHARPTLFDFLAAHNASPGVEVPRSKKVEKCSAALRADAGDAICHSFLGLGKDGLPPLVPGCDRWPRAGSERLPRRLILTIEGDPLQINGFLANSQEKALNRR